MLYHFQGRYADAGRVHSHQEFQLQSVLGTTRAEHLLTTSSTAGATPAKNVDSPRVTEWAPSRRGGAGQICGYTWAHCIGDPSVAIPAHSAISSLQGRLR
jgi:hypothetical protein